MERNVSYGELAVLEEMFDEQTAGHVFEDDDIKDQCKFDFIDQYIHGNDNPEVRYL